MFRELKALSSPDPLVMELVQTMIKYGQRPTPRNERAILRAVSALCGERWALDELRERDALRGRDEAPKTVSGAGLEYPDSEITTDELWSSGLCQEEDF